MGVSSYDDMIDSRDVIERIEDLETEQTEWVEGSGVQLAEWLEDGNSAEDFVAGMPLDEFEGAGELRLLTEFAEAAAKCSEDWAYGATLIRESYFVNYVQEYAADTIEGWEEKSSQWPFNCIDWDEAAAVLQQDYTSVEFEGITYYVR